MKLFGLPTKLWVLLRLHPVQPPSTPFDFRLWSGAQNHQHALTPRNPVLMDIDASRVMQPLPFSCYRCGKAGHKAPDSPTWFDIRELSIDVLQTYLEDCLAELDAMMNITMFCTMKSIFSLNSTHGCHLIPFFELSICWWSSNTDPFAHTIQENSYTKSPCLHGSNTYFPIQICPLRLMLWYIWCYRPYKE